MVRFLRKILLAVYVSSLVLGGVFPFSVSAAIPNVINYQSRLRSSSLAPITALTSIQFTLYTDPVLGTSGGGLSSSGPVLWKEVHDGITCAQVQPDTDGYFSVQLGACTPFPSYITWNQQLYLGVKIASDSEASPRVLLGAHQYALNSQALNGFTASTTAQANTILALDGNQNFNIATGTFMGAGLTITASSSLQNVTFAVATGTSLNLANYLSIGAIRLDQTGTTNLTSGAYLVGVFDEFTNSNATTVQAALRDFDIALTAVSSTSNPTSTLQRAYDGGGIGLGNTISLATSTPIRIQTTVPGVFSSQNGIVVTRNDVPNQGIVFGSTNFGSNFSHFGMSDDISNITGASGVFAFYNHSQNNFGFSLLGQSGAAKSVFTLTNPDLGNKAAFEIENQSTINSTGILRLRNIPDSANIELHVGMSSPEGVITSDVGNIFFRRDGTASGTQLYIKTQEANNQGWVGVATVDMLNAGAATLQSAYDGSGIAAGRQVDVVPGQGIILSSATNTAQSIGFNPILSVVGDNTAGFSTTTGIALGNLDVGGGQVPAIMLGTAVNQVGNTPFGYQLFNPNSGNGYYDIGLANGVETYGLLTFTQTETRLDAVTGTLTLRSLSNTDISVSTGQVNLTATAQTDQLGAFQFNYNTSTGQGIRLVNSNDGADAGISIGLLSPEGLLLADSGSVFMRNSSASGTQMYLKTTNGVNTGWVGVATVDMLGSAAEADTFQTVTDRGNSTTNTIQFAGGTSTALFTLTKSLVEGGGLLEPQLLIKDTTSTGGIVLGRYSTGVDENYSSLVFTEDTSLNPSYTTSISFDYSHINNNLLMRSYGGGVFKNGISLGDVVNFETALDHGIGVTSAFNFINYGSLKGIISFSNPQASMDFFMATGSPVGAIAANSGSLYFRTDAASTSTAHLFIKTADSSSGGWKQVALLEDVTSTAGTLQTVTNLGNTTTNTIQFAGGTSTGQFVVQSTSTMRDIIPAGPYAGNVSSFNLGSTTTRWNNLWAETVNVGSSTWSLSQNSLNNFAIFNGPNKTGNEVMTIDTATENVGFGTMAQGIAPQARLHVLGGSVLMGGNTSEEIFRLDPVANTVSLGDSTAWNSNTYLQVDDNNRRIIMPNGNVGIGTAAPTAQFEVAGRMNQTALDNLAVSTGPQKVVIQGRYAYVASINAEKMTIVDISNPRSMVEMGSVGVSKSPTDIVVQGQYAYVTAFDTSVLYTFDVSDPTSPTQIGVLGLTGGSPTGIVVEGNYGYVITQGGDRLEVIDLSDPTAENSITSVGICTSPNQMAISGHYAYVTCLDSTMAVVDIRDPASPVVMNTIAVGSNPQGVHIRGRYLYLTSYNNRELEIYDIKRPTDPVLVSNTSVCRGPSAVKVQSNIAYVSCENDNTITSVDVTDPTRPSIIGTNLTSDTPRYFAISGRYLFVPVFGIDAIESFDLGGGFLQQLEVGGFEADTLSVLNGAQIGSNLSVEGSVSIGRNARVNGTFTVSGGIPGVSSAFTIDQRGRVGIGTSSPDQALSVNGDASKIGGGTWSTFSDQRLKSDISAYDDGLDLITKINPVNFRYNGLGGIATSSKSYVGILAQDIQQVAPYMVATTSVMLHKTDSAPTEVLTFDPNAITYALINSVKQLNAKLDQGSTSKQVTITTTTQGEIHFGGIISFDTDTVGQAKILSGSKEVRVTFSHAYSAQPIVTVSPMDFVDAMYRVSDVNNKGFTIQLNTNQSGDRLFSWHAFAGSSAQVFVSDGTTSTVQLIEQAPQPDEQVSSTPQIPPPIEPMVTPDPVPLESVTTSTSSTESTL